MTEDDHVALLSYKDMAELSFAPDTRNDAIVCFDKKQLLSRTSAAKYQPIHKFSGVDFHNFC